MVNVKLKKYIKNFKLFILNVQICEERKNNIISNNEQINTRDKLVKVESFSRLDSEGAGWAELYKYHQIC